MTDLMEINETSPPGTVSSMQRENKSVWGLITQVAGNGAS